MIVLGAAPSIPETTSLATSGWLQIENKAGVTGVCKPRLCYKRSADVQYCKGPFMYFNPYITCCYISVNKVITTMVIRPLDDRTYCVRSAFTHLEVKVKVVI